MSCNFWIARYPSGKIMEVSVNPPSNKKPLIQGTLEGWQYTSKGRISGISGNVDMNLWYDEFVEEITDLSKNPYSSPKRVLRLRSILMHGNDVKWVQYHLVRLGFLPPRNSSGKDNVDGIYGRDTKMAVWAAQEYFGITVDGIVGPETTHALQYN